MTGILHVRKCTWKQKEGEIKNNILRSVSKSSRYLLYDSFYSVFLKNKSLKRQNGLEII